MCQTDVKRKGRDLHYDKIITQMAGTDWKTCIKDCVCLHSHTIFLFKKKRSKYLLMVQYGILFYIYILYFQYENQIKDISDEYCRFLSPTAAPASILYGVLEFDAAEVKGK